MKKIIIASSFIAFLATANAQLPEGYVQNVRKGDSLMALKLFEPAAQSYSNAFAFNDGKASQNDRYSAASAWAMAGNLDSAFANLMRLAERNLYTNYNRIVIDSRFKNLYGDERWNKAIGIIKANKEKNEVGLLKPVVAILDTMYQEDQKVREGINELILKYGGTSPEARERSRQMGIVDSLNLLRLSRILDAWGWLGPDKVGAQGALTLFLVLQHSKTAVQKKYLPKLREAVANKQAEAYYLAYVEDRVALAEGREQSYGTQYAYDPASKKIFIRSLQDPENVDKRRAALGLASLNDYLKQLGTSWNLEEYKSAEAEKIREDYEREYRKRKGG